MRENLVKRNLAAGEPVFGVIAPTTDPIIAEYIGHLGFDFYMMDGEHGSIDPPAAETLVRACEAAGTTPLARIRSNDPALILQYMDAGVMGVMMPGIATVEDVQVLVDAIKYPPLGSRGLGPVRAASYMMGTMSQAKYVAFANEQTLVLPQFEDIASLDRLPDIVQVDGVDGVIIGPRDLAMSMGFYDGPGHPEVQDAVAAASNIVLDAGLILGTVAGTREAADALIERGARFCLNSVQNLIAQSGKAFLGTAS